MGEGEGQRKKASGALAQPPRAPEGIGRTLPACRVMAKQLKTGEAQPLFCSDGKTMTRRVSPRSCLRSCRQGGLHRGWGEGQGGRKSQSPRNGYSVVRYPGEGLHPAYCTTHAKAQRNTRI